MSTGSEALKVEHFDKGADIEFRVLSVPEKLIILRDMIAEDPHFALHYGGETPLLTILLDADEDGMWFEPLPTPEENDRLLEAEKITLVGQLHHVKIQFETKDMEMGKLYGAQALYMELPPYLLRIMRREFFRIPVPAEDQVVCIVPTPPKCSDDKKIMRELPVMEISGDGVGLLCGKNEEHLLPGKAFRDCKIVIPGFGEINGAALTVRSSIEFTAPDGAQHKHVGCHLVFHDPRTGAMLQRYLVRLQGKVRKMQQPEEE